jgi:hypothetical protein
VKKTAFVRGALLGLAVAALPFLAPAAHGSVFHRLLGEAPPDTGRGRPAIGAALDSLDVGRHADAGAFHLTDQAAALAGGDAARTGVPGIARPYLVGGPGYGRLPLVVDGFPAGQGVVHWDDPAWFPVRGLARFELAGGAGALAADGGAGRTLVADTFAGPARPASVVSLMGGSFGHRLAELDFARQFGRVKFHADVADYGHDGFGVIGRTDAARGFGRLDFPLSGFDATARVGLASGEMDAGGAGVDQGIEMTKSSSFALHLGRAAGAGRWDLRVLRESSRLEVESFGAESFQLTRGRWWGQAARTWRGGTVDWTASAFGSAEERDGVLPGSATFAGGGAGLAVRAPAFGTGEAAARFRVASLEPTGLDVEAGASLRTDGWWIDAARTRLVPAMLLHQDQPLAGRERVADVLERLESLERAERHTRLAVGLAAGGAFRVAAELSGVRSEDRQPWLSLAPGAPLGPVTDGWSGEARLAARWRPSTTFDGGVSAGAATFHAADEPFRPRFTADGWARVARNYFQRSLLLTGELRGRLLGERREPGGLVYPTLLTADGILTAEVETLTLFLRFDNLTDLFIESDWRDPEFPLALPGLSSRIGATLRLAD